MPNKPLHACRHKRCAALVQAGESYCPVHKVLHKQDFARKNPERQNLYNARWEDYRKLFLAEHPYCINYETCHNLATVVDHIIDHEGDYQRFWDHANHQPMCDTCHRQKTAKTTKWGR